MPTYQYTCTACGHHLEAVQSFSDEPLTQCPACTGQLRKLYSAVGIVFKGSGFYRTDSRAAARGSNGSSKSHGNGRSSGAKESTTSSSTTSGNGSGSTAASGSGPASPAPAASTAA